MTKHIFLVSPRGFCAGVRRALATVEYCLKNFKNQQIYVYHDIVHNTHVVNGFKKRGVIFVEDISLIPRGAIVIFSAHGVSKKIVKQAEELDLKIIDATCPLVTKIHRKAELLTARNCAVILIGHRNHPEVIGTIGQVGEKYRDNVFLVENIDDANKFDEKLVANFDCVSCLTQTTFSVEQINKIMNVLKEKIPNLEANDDICYATTNRQEAVKSLAKKCDLVLVVGSKHSSNSQRLKELSSEYGVQSLLIDDFKSLEKDYAAVFNNISQYENIGITAGASAPEFLVEELIQKLSNLLDDDVSIEQIECDGEHPDFTLPSGLKCS